MTITFPRTDIIGATSYSDQKFSLVSRQELSTQANGVVRGKDFGSAIWMAEYTTVVMRSDDGVAFEAILNSLDGVINPFEGGDLRRQYPRLYANGVFNDTGQINSINANNKAVSFKSLPAGFVLSVGDYFSFTYAGFRALHQIMESVTANGGGTTAEFEVRPFIRPGLTVSTAVVLKQPRALFTLLPGSVNSTLQVGRQTTVNFKAVQYLS